VHRLARPEFDQGLADMNVRMEKMVLVIGVVAGVTLLIINNTAFGQRQRAICNP
jgi:hypothetical protein